MNNQKLLDTIRQHETRCAENHRIKGPFQVSKVTELGEGIIGVRDTDGEHTIYFDAETYRVPDKSAFSDSAKKIGGFPKDVGFVTDVMAKSWGDIAGTASIALTAFSGSAIEIHPEPIQLEY